MSACHVVSKTFYNCFSFQRLVCNGASLLLQRDDGQAANLQRVARLARTRPFARHVVINTRPPAARRAHDVTAVVVFAAWHQDDVIGCHVSFLSLRYTSRIYPIISHVSYISVWGQQTSRFQPTSSRKRSSARSLFVASSPEVTWQCCPTVTSALQRQQVRAQWKRRRGRSRASSCCE